VWAATQQNSPYRCFTITHKPFFLYTKQFEKSKFKLTKKKPNKKKSSTGTPKRCRRYYYYIKKPFKNVIVLSLAGEKIF